MFPFQDRFEVSTPARRRHRRTRRRGVLPGVERLEGRVVLSTASAPPVIYKIETLLSEDAMHSGFDSSPPLQYVVPEPFISADPSWSGQITTQAVAQYGTLSGEASASVRMEDGTVVVDQALNLKYEHRGGWQVFIDQVETSVTVTPYVLGAPGTRYSYTAEASWASAITPYDGFTTNFSRSVVGYSHPGWHYNWASDGQNGPWEGQSKAETIEYKGQIYSLAVPDTVASIRSFWGTSVPLPNPFTVTGATTAEFRIKVTNLATDIKMLSAELTAPDVVSYSYEIVGASLGPRFPVPAYIYRSSDDKFDPEEDLLVGRSSLPDDSVGVHTGEWKGRLAVDSSRPYILIVADPINSVVEVDDDPFNEDNTIEVTNPAPDLVATDLAWDDEGGVAFSYDVLRSALPDNATLGLYWAAGGRFEDVLSPAIFSLPTERAVGSYGPIGVDRSILDLTPRPQGTTHLLLALDPPDASRPDGEIVEASESNNVLAIPVPTPEVEILVNSTKTTADDITPVGQEIEALIVNKGAAGTITLQVKGPGPVSVALVEMRDSARRSMAPVSGDVAPGTSVLTIFLAAEGEPGDTALVRLVPSRVSDEAFDFKLIALYEEDELAQAALTAVEVVFDPVRAQTTPVNMSADRIPPRVETSTKVTVTPTNLKGQHVSLKILGAGPQNGEVTFAGGETVEIGGGENMVVLQGGIRQTEPGQAGSLVLVSYVRQDAEAGRSTGFSVVAVPISTESKVLHVASKWELSADIAKRYNVAPTFGPKEIFLGVVSETTLTSDSGNPEDLLLTTIHEVNSQTLGLERAKLTDANGKTIYEFQAFRSPPENSNSITFDENNYTKLIDFHGWILPGVEARVEIGEVLKLFLKTVTDPGPDVPEKNHLRYEVGHNMSTQGHEFSTPRIDSQFYAISRSGYEIEKKFDLEFTLVETGVLAQIMFSITKTGHDFSQYLAGAGGFGPLGMLGPSAFFAFDRPLSPPPSTPPPSTPPPSTPPPSTPPPSTPPPTGQQSGSDSSASDPTTGPPAPTRFLTGRQPVTALRFGPAHPAPAEWVVMGNGPRLLRVRLSRPDFPLRVDLGPGRFGGTFLIDAPGAVLHLTGGTRRDRVRILLTPRARDAQIRVDSDTLPVLVRSPGTGPRRMPLLAGDRGSAGLFNRPPVPVISRGMRLPSSAYMRPSFAERTPEGS